MRYLLAGLLVLSAASCTNEQRDSALTAVRDMQSSGVAQAAEPLDGSDNTWTLQETPGAPPVGDPPPSEQPGTPGGPPAADQQATPAEAAAPAEETKPDPIQDFVDSDPRDILVAKRDDLKARQTSPWDTERPETFIPETGRKDPMTIVLNAVPKELLPPRSADDDESDLQTYLFTALATQALQGVTANLQCHNVIQIGIQKYAQMSFGDGQRFVISEGNGFNQGTRVGPLMMNISLNVSSISTKEVIVDVAVVPQGTAVSVTKQLVFIPRN